MDSSSKLNRYLAHLSEGLGCDDRQEGLSGCCTGLSRSRKNVESMRTR